MDLSWVTPGQIYWTIFISLWIVFSFKLYLLIREGKLLRASVKIPKALRGIVKYDTFEKSRRYSIDKNAFSIFYDLYGTLVLTALMSFEWWYHCWNLSGHMLKMCNCWPTSWDNEVGQSICFSVIDFTFVNLIIGLPPSFYSTMMLEKKHGFNQHTTGSFLKDYTVNSLANVVLVSSVIGPIVKIVQIGGQYFFMWLWIFCSIVGTVLTAVQPLKPLRNGPFKARLEKLAASINFPVRKLYILNVSQHSSHSDACFSGGFCSTRIILYDTLIKRYVSQTSKEEKGCNDDEVEAVLAHELGHWKLNHIVKNSILSQINLIITFALFAYLYKTSILYQAFGFLQNGQEPIIVGLIIVLHFILQVYAKVTGYLKNALCRNFEYEADAFAVQLNYGKSLKSALVKMNKENLGFPISDPLYSAWYHNHPTLCERLHEIDVSLKLKKTK